MISNINDIVEYNSKLIGFSEQDINCIHQHREILLSCAETIVKLFYDRLFSVEKTKAIFEEGERVAREQTLANWYTKTLTEAIDDNYWKWQWYVGVVHIKRQVENPMMISMTTAIQEIVLQTSIDKLGQEQGLQLYMAFKRLMTVVVSLIAKSYELGLLEAIQQTTGMSAALIQTNIKVGIDKEIAKVKQELGL